MALSEPAQLTPPSHNTAFEGSPHRGKGTAKRDCVVRLALEEVGQPLYDVRLCFRFRARGRTRRIVGLQSFWGQKFDYEKKAISPCFRVGANRVP